MPIYEYQCVECDAVFEEWQSGFDELEKKCPHCGAPSKRLISNTSFVLKGGGWYVTDYAGKKPGVTPSESPGNGEGKDGGNGNGNGNGKAAKTKEKGKAEPKAAPAGKPANTTTS